MATLEVISALTTVVEDCLADKLQAGFDANAQLTVDVAKEIAAQLEYETTKYTDIEITEVMNLITNTDVDLGPFTAFMNSMKEILDGDEETEGYQIFTTLVSDTNNNTQTLINHSTSIGLIQSTLSTMQTTITDHSDRITALENAQHEPLDCEECHDELLDILKSSINNACGATAASISAYRTTTASAVLSDWRNELAKLRVTINNGIFYVLDGQLTSGWNCDEVTLPGDFEVETSFAISGEYTRSNTMLFGGSYETDLYCRVEQSDRSIRVWMDSVDDLDYVSFVPENHNVFDGKMHNFTLKRVGSVFKAWIDNEYLGEQPAYTYAGPNNMGIGIHRSQLAAGQPMDGIVEKFIVKDATDTVLIDLENNLGVTPLVDLLQENFASVDNGTATKWVSTQSSRSFRRSPSVENGVTSIVLIGASILEQSFYSESDAEKRFAKHGRLADVYKRAVSGDTSSDTLTKLPAILEEFKGFPGKVLFVLHTGGNDNSQGTGYPDNGPLIGSNIEAIINGVKAAGFDIAVSSMTYRIPPASNPSEPYNTNVIIPKINSLLPEWMDGTRPIIDLYTQTFDNSATWLEVDGIHPNGFGEASIREYIAERVCFQLASNPDYPAPFTSGKVYAEDLLINFGNTGGLGFLKSESNSVIADGTYGAVFRNMDHTLATGFSFTVAGFVGNAPNGVISGPNEKSIRNKNVNRSYMYVEQPNAGMLTFNASSFKVGSKYTIRIASSREAVDERVTQFYVGGTPVQVNSTADSPEFIEVNGITSEDLVAHGISVMSTNNAYGYISGIHFEIEAPELV